MAKYYVHKKDGVYVSPDDWEKEAVETIILTDKYCNDDDAIQAFYELGYNEEEYILSDSNGFLIRP